MIETISLGILGSVLGTFVFLFLSGYWKNMLLPRIEDMIYKGVRISGKWSAEIGFDQNEKQVFTLELRQRADKISGVASLTSDIREGTSTTTNSFTGYISDGFLIGTTRPNTPDSLYHTTYNFRVVEALETVSLKGIMCGLDLNKNEISNWDLEFKKKND